MRIGFFGTPDLARDTLAACHKAGHEIVYIVSQPDKPVGRRSDLQPSPVSLFAIDQNILLLRPERIRENFEFLSTLKSHLVDFIIVVAYGKILPLSILQLPKYMSINVHWSLLPRYRWASPIQTALLEGDRVTGVTIMTMSEWMDEGDILSTHEISISNDETTATLFEKFAQIAPQVLLDALDGIVEGTISPIPQSTTGVTYTKKFDRVDGKIDFLSHSALEIYRKYQAFTPWPWVWTVYNGVRLKIHTVELESGIHNLLPGECRASGEHQVLIWTNSGVVCLGDVTLEWSKRRSSQEFFLGDHSVDIKRVFV